MENLTTIISSGIGVIALLIFYFWFYKQYCIDRTRQDLFAVRNKLFDYASEGHISFNDPAYVLLRHTMNGMIRFTHRVDVLTIFGVLLVKMLVPQREVDSFEKRFNNALTNIESREVQQQLLKFYMRMNLIIIAHLMKSSVLAILFSVITIFSMYLYRGWKNLKETIAKRFPGISQIDTLASKIGQAA